MVREAELIESYETWDADEESISDFVARLGVSRQRLYSVLNKHGVKPKSKRSDGFHVPQFDDSLTHEMAEMALAFLVNQLYEARQELAEYRERYGPLD